MTANAGMAAWCTPRGVGDTSAAELHVNFWRIAGDHSFVRKAGKGARDFAELGVLLDSPRSVEKICIYLPGTVWDIEDWSAFRWARYCPWNFQQEPYLQRGSLAGSTEG